MKSTTNTPRRLSKREIRAGVKQIVGNVCEETMTSYATALVDIQTFIEAQGRSSEPLVAQLAVLTAVELIGRLADTLGMSARLSRKDAA